MLASRFDRRTRPIAFARVPRRSIRLRLTMTYAALFLISGAILLTIGYRLVVNTFPDPRAHNLALAAKREAAIAPGHPTPAAFIAQDQHKRVSVLHRLLVDYLVVLGVMSLLSVALGWLAATRVLRPLQKITTTTRSISARNLHERLAISGPDDELKEIGDTIDSLLARLEGSFQSQRRFVANASHELRTPLALEQALLEAALTDPQATPTSWRATCERVLAGSQQQARLIESLLSLARSEGGLDRHVPVELAQLADLLLDVRRPVAEREGLELAAQLHSAPTLGDPQLIERLIANLLDNALHHNVERGWVQVTTSTNDDRAVFSIVNSGPDVPAADVARLLAPFQRLGTDRTSHGGGLGLGLSIVQAIATAHGADLDVRSREGGGLVIEARFSLDRSASRASQTHPSTMPTLARRA